MKQNPLDCPTPGLWPPAMFLTSPIFTEEQPIPAKYTGDGADVSPPLQWRDVPAGTKSFTLVCEDPDAPLGTWVHWLLYNLPATICALPEHLPTSDTLPNGAKQGINDFKRVGYGGPFPPRGSPHHYYFKLYALNTELSLKPQALKSELL